jgi:hypothetical protein
MMGGGGSAVAPDAGLKLTLRAAPAVRFGT